MNNIIQSAKQCLTKENYTAALFICLSIPDICGKLERKDNKNINDSKIRYIKWFNKYLGTKYQGYLSAEDCYALRCALIHEGSDTITYQKIHKVIEKYIFITKGAHLNRFSNTSFFQAETECNEILQISIESFCNDIISAAEKWIADVKDNKDIEKNLNSIIKIHKPGESIGGISFQ